MNPAGTPTIPKSDEGFLSPPRQKTGQYLTLLHVRFQPHVVYSIFRDLSIIRQNTVSDLVPEYKQQNSYKQRSYFWKKYSRSADLKFS